MKPTATAHILRKAMKDLGASARITNDGYLEERLSMPDPHDFSCAKSFARAYQIYNLARKREPLEATELQMRNALATWVESEWRCRVMNMFGSWVTPIDPERRDLLSRLKQRARATISRVLMDHWIEWELNPTAGATSSMPRALSFAFSKVDGTPMTFANDAPYKCVPAASELLEELFLENPAIADSFITASYSERQYGRTIRHLPEYYKRLEIRALVRRLCTDVPTTVLTYVPKEVNTVRLIGTPQALTVMVQKLGGDLMRRALAQEGIDLNNQTINQEWAEIGSLTNLVATVDLSAASDSIALHHLDWFPERWRNFFLATRDPKVRVGDVEHKLSKVAGMGNGYIFELESLLFYAMARAVVEEEGGDTSFVSVYGDDIIVPVQHYDTLVDFFLHEGFLINREKSFANGPFRESCGKHYFNGKDVTPWYARREAGTICDLYHYCNGLTEWSSRTGVPIQEVIDLVLHYIPAKHRILVPETWGSRSGLHHAHPGVMMPEQRYNKKWQRVVTRYVYYRPKAMELRPRFGSSVQLRGWLSSCKRERVLPDWMGCRAGDPVLPHVFSVMREGVEAISCKVE